MTLGKRTILTASYALLAWLTGPAAESQACGLFDWLFHHHRRPAATTSFMPAAPAGNACQTTCQRTVVQYVPQTTYRTVWNRVPVTNFRTVQRVDPCTGCPVAAAVPCTTYRWQLQRVPMTSYRPVYRTVTVQMPVTTVAPQVNAFAAPTVSGCNACAGAGCANCAPAAPASTYSAPQAAPTYNAPANGGSIYRGPATRAPQPTPADVAPRIDPNSAPAGSGSNSRFRPNTNGGANGSGSRSQPSPNNNGQQPATNPSGSSARSSVPYYYRRTTERRPTESRANERVAPAPRSTLSAPRFNAPAVTPIPDRDWSAPAIESPRRVAPLPEDKTAARRYREANNVRRMAATATYRIPARREAPRRSAAKQRPAPPAADEWDESGWQAAP